MNINTNTLTDTHSDRLQKTYKQDIQFDLSLIISNSEENLFVINRNYEIVMCNHVVISDAKKYLGIDLELGMSVFVMAREDEKEMLKGYCDKALMGEKSELEYFVDIPGKEREYFNISYKPAVNSKNVIVGAIIIGNNISEKKRVSQTLLQTEQRWRFALEGSNQGVWDWNIKTNEVYFSPSWKKMLGYKDEEISNLFSEWINLLHPADRERMQKYISENLLSNETYYETEQRLKAKNGSYIWILSRGMVIERSEAGAPFRVIGTHTDITERKISEENYKLLFHNNPLPMWTYDKKSLKFLNVNDAAVEHYGYSREEFLQMTILDICPEEEKEKNILNDTSDAEWVQKKCWRHKKKNGEIIFVNIEGKILDAGKTQQTLVLAKDITEQITSQEKLTQSENQYRSLFKSSPLPSFIYDHETMRFLEVNDAAVKLYGYTIKEFSKITLLDLHLPEHHTLLRESIAINKKRENSLLSNWKLINKNRELIIGDLSACDIHYNDRNARLVILNDLTERVKTEQELCETNRRFQFVAQATSNIIWDWDIQSNKIIYSENYFKVLGWELSEDRKLPMEVGIARIHPEDRKRVCNKLQDVIANAEKNIWEEQFRYSKVDGSFAYMIDRGFISRDEKGQALRMVGAFEDISNRKYQEELQTLELRVFEVSVVPGISFHTVLMTLINGFENLHQGIQASICLFALSDEVEIVAPGLSKEHTRALRYFVEKQKNRLQAEPHLQRDIIVSSVDSEDWKNAKDGVKSYQWKTSWSVPVYQHGGGLLAFITFFLEQSRMPSDQEQNALARLRNLLRILMINHLSLEQIRISNERYDNMLKATHDLVWDWNLETGTFYRNKEGLKKVYGIDDANSIQNIYSWMERIHPSDHIKVQRVINDILHATNEDTFDVEYRFKRDDGDYAFIYDRGVIVRNKEGKPLRMIGAAQNVTDRKKLEQDLLQQELNKQKFISQATLDTQEQERREIGKELHDNVNQVLTTTKLYLDLSVSSPDLKDELIKKSTKNIIYVINEIRQLSRSLMDPSIGDLGLLDSINALVENINVTRKIHVSVSAPSDLDKDLDDRQKLMVFRVIQEAMNNTIKYAQATLMQLTIKVADGNLQLIIADDGKGFDMASVKKGAGLKNIQNRVYLNDGTLLIDTEVGKGCKITINFPINKKLKSE